MPRQEHGPADDGKQEVARFGDELERHPQPEEREDIQVALVVGNVNCGRVFRREVLFADDFDPGEKELIE